MAESRDLSPFKELIDAIDVIAMSAKGKKNVQEQVSTRKRAIVETATSYLSSPIGGIEQLLDTRGLNFPRGVIVDLSAYPECCDHIYEGVVVGNDDRFYRFVAELSDDETELLNLDEWNEISKEIEVCNHKRGIGRTFGALALEVRNELLASLATDG